MHSEKYGKGTAAKREILGDAFREEARAFVQSAVSNAVHGSDASASFPVETCRQARTEGLAHPLIETALGGAGLGWLGTLILAEELGAVCPGIGLALFNTQTALYPICRAGTARQKTEYVTNLLARDGLASLCFTEPEGGSNLTGVRARAVKNAEGWELAGEKGIVGGAVAAGLYVVLARIEDEIALFAVPRSDAVQVKPASRTLGLRALEPCTVGIDGVRVGPEALIARGPEGLELIRETLDQVRLIAAATAVGIGVGCIRAIIPWCWNRNVDDGRPLAAKSHVQLEIARVHADIESARLLIERAAREFEAGKPVSPDIAMAKARASQTALAAANLAVNLFGWRGASEQWGIEKRLRDARTLTAYGGTNEIMLLEVFREVTRTVVRAAPAGP